MKKVYLIQYITENSVIENRIKSLGEWTKYFTNDWLLSSNLSAKEIYTILSEGYENTNILIVELNLTNSNYYGRMSLKVWDFFKNKKA